jgi:DNA-binding SARP family transcriptional activator/predicted ATPase
MRGTPARGSTLEIRLFGGLHVLERGHALKFSAPAKAASLLAYLIVHRSEQASRDAIAFMFWPDDDETRARANLRRHVALILHALPNGTAQQPILADNRSIRWNPLYPCTIDIAEFEQLSAAATGAADATALYRGDLLPAAYDEWILPERERLRSMHSANLERLTERYAAAGDYARAIATTRALLTHDPWREDAVRTLLSLRHAAGDRAGALQEYEAFAERLRRDLDVAPMPETVSRYESIQRSTDPSVPERPASALERSTVPATMPFVGRGEELLRLRQMWVRAMRGFGGVAVVSGEAGIGKSRLTAELGATVAAQGGAVVGGAATFPEAMPYQAVIEALRSSLPSIASLAVDATWLAAAADVLPDLRDGDAALPRLPALEPERQRDRLFEAVWRCFESLARVRPLLLVFEDIHWAGPATIDLLAYIARRTRNHPILVLVTCRDDEADTAHPLRVLRHALRRSGAFASIPLGGITATDVAVVLAAVLAGPGETAGFARRAHDLCCGNPFFLAEIVRDCLAAPAVLEPVLPHSLAASIESRVAALSPEAQSLAGIAAVVGRAFTVEIIAAAAGASEGTAERCMDALLDARLIHASSGDVTRGGDFVFSHDLIRAQLYERIPESMRRRLHRRIGTVLETLYASEREALAGDLARHFDQGQDAEKAAAAYLAAARQALRLYADGEAMRALSRAAELTGDPEVRFDAVSLREAIHGRAGRRAEQFADLETLERLATTIGDERRRLECMRRRVLYARAIDDVEAQQRWIAALRSRIGDAGAGSWSAFCSEASAVLMTSLGRHDEALSNARAALSAYQQAGDDAGAVRSLCSIADIATLRGDPAASQTALDDATAIAVASSNEASIVRALAASALAAYMSVDYERARTSAERGLEICRTIGDREGEADFLFRLGNIAGRRFAVADAVERYAEATAIYAALNKPLGQAIVLLNTGLLYLKIGENAKALAALKGARAIFLDVNDLRGLTICALNLGMAAYLCRRFGAALRLSRRAVALAHRLGNPQLECSALGNVGAAERELGEREASLTHSEEALAQRRRMAPMDIGSDLADMGLTYLRAGDLGRACAIAEEIEALPAPALESVMFPQNVLWSAAQIYAAAERHEAYARALVRAAAFYEDRRAKIPDGPWRDTYGLLFFNRQIREASDRFRTPR